MIARQVLYLDSCNKTQPGRQKNTTGSVLASIITALKKNGYFDKIINEFYIATNFNNILAQDM